jgi:hypothetical protein
MRDELLNVGALLFFLLVAMPWFSIYDWVRKERGKKYKSREDVI